MSRLLLGFLAFLGLGSTLAQASERGKPSRPAADLTAVCTANNRVALDLYARLRSHTPGNLLFSPFSISSTLAMASAGARGETLTQIQRTLHLPEQDRLHPALGELLTQIARKHKGCQVHPVNTLWLQRGFVLTDRFSDTMRAHYRAGLRRADFASAPEEARRHINAWVERQTQERIRNLLRPGSIDTRTVLVLTSAVHFKGDWARPFPREATREGAFSSTSQKAASVSFMRQTAPFAYVETAGAQVLELPYVGKELSMIVLLPRKEAGLGELEKVLTYDRIETCLKALKPTVVDVTLPRFRLLVELQLKPILSALGMPQAFSRAADFSGMERSKSVNLSAVVHKAAVDVNEQGTEASAASASTVKSKSAAPVVTFRADRPFVFLIRDNRTGCTLFLGRVIQPRG